MSEPGPALGQQREVRLERGVVRYWERGDGPPVVFVHGLLVNSGLWRKVVPTVAGAGFRCIAPDWPLGSHELSVPDADLTPPGVARMVADLLERLDLHDVTIVANDSGGAITQIMLAEHPDRVARVVLTNCDSLERFFPPMFAWLPAAAAVPGSTWALTQSLRLRALHRLPFTFGRLSKRPIPDDVIESFLLPSRRDPAIRADLRRFVRAVHRRHTLAAAEKLPSFDKPVLLAWAEECRLFPMSLARRLCELLPQAELVTVRDSLTFVSEDQPDWLTEQIIRFARVG